MSKNNNAENSGFRQSGFSLIELLTVLSIIIILSVCTAHYYLPFLFHAPTELLRDEVLHHLNYARTQAIKQKTIISLCGMQDNKTCTNTWEKGYLIFSENTKNNTKNINIIKIHQNSYKNSLILGKINHPDNILRFMPNGQAQKNGRIILRSNTDPAGDLTQTIMISLSGRVRIADNSDYTIENKTKNKAENLEF